MIPFPGFLYMYFINARIFFADGLDCMEPDRPLHLAYYYYILVVYDLLPGTLGVQGSSNKMYDGEGESLHRITQPQL